MNELQLWTIWLCIWLFVLGASLGSFLDCAVSRWTAGESWTGGRSRCVSCGHGLSARDLIPVWSFLTRRGRCRYCGARIPWECLTAELAGGLGLVCLGVHFGPSLELGQWAVWEALLLALSLTDWAARVIPDKLLLAMLANRAVWFLLLGHGLPEALAALKSCAIPAVLLGTVLLAEKRLGREVMGGGDLKLLFVLALYLDWGTLLLTLLAGCLLGLLWAAAARWTQGEAMPFGPFLAAGAVLTVCYGGPLLEWYFGFF